MIRLIQEFGAHTGRAVTFDQPSVKIGRAPDNDVAFDPHLDLDASGLHCEIVREDGAFFLTDRGSRNGTLLNNVRITRQRLSTGDVIECGNGGPRLRVEVRTGATESLAPPSQPGRGSSTPVPPSSPSGPYGTIPMSLSHAPSSANLGSIVPARGISSVPSPPVEAPFGIEPSSHGGRFTPIQGSGPPSIPAPLRPVSVPPGAVGPEPPSAGTSVGASVAAQLPQGAQVGKRTLAFMIDAAIVQAGGRRGSVAGTILVVSLVVALVGALAGGAYLVYTLKHDRDERSTLGAGERITQHNEGAIYLLVAVHPGTGSRGFCTGFAVTQDLIATNAHCVDVAQDQLARGNTLVALRSNGRGAQLSVVPVFRDARFRNAAYGMEGSGYDVGILRATDGLPLPVTVRLATDAEARSVRQGAQIYVYGFPGLAMNEVSPVATITTGIINRTTDFFDRAADAASAQKVQHTAQTTSGSSGSPIFLANGSVIAVNAGSLADEERQSMTDPRTGQRVNVDVNRSSNFKYGMRVDLLRQAVLSVGQEVP